MNPWVQNASIYMNLNKQFSKEIFACLQRAIFFLQMNTELPSTSVGALICGSVERMTIRYYVDVYSKYLNILEVF